MGVAIALKSGIKFLKKLKKPMTDSNLATSLGLFIFFKVSNFPGSTVIPLSEILNPKRVTSFLKNEHFSSLIAKSVLRKVSNTFASFS